MTTAERRSIDNGIWLCQRCAKLVDNDPARYTIDALKGWKNTAENEALRELETSIRATDTQLQIFEKLERQMPKLLAEMRDDLQSFPLRRKFALLKKSWTYWSSGNEFVYYDDEHPELDGMMFILQNYGPILDITATNVHHFVMSEELVDYLTGTGFWEHM